MGQVDAAHLTMGYVDDGRADDPRPGMYVHRSTW
jgi:hypothetical protein